MFRRYGEHFKFGPVVQEMSFKEKVYAQRTMDTQQRPITLAPLETSAQVSKTFEGKSVNISYP